MGMVTALARLPSMHNQAMNDETTCGLFWKMRHRGTVQLKRRHWESINFNPMRSVQHLLRQRAAPVTWVPAAAAPKHRTTIRKKSNYVSFLDNQQPHDEPASVAPRDSDSTSKRWR